MKRHIAGCLASAILVGVSTFFRENTMRAAPYFFAFLAISFSSISSWAEGLNLDQIEGVYRKKVKILAAGNDTFPGEDILEIVRMTDRSAYIRIHLDVYNGHICSIHGVAEFHEDVLTYDSGDFDGCSLSVKFSKDDVSLIDRNLVCSRLTCGVGGSYDEESFSAKSKRKIRYMSRLKNSTEYKSAVEEYDTVE